MTAGKRYNIAYRRQREGKTNYKVRLKLLMSASPRLVLRRTNKRILMQVVTYTPQGDDVVACANSSDLSAFGWSAAKQNAPAAYLTGFLLGSRMKAAGIESAITDFGLQTAHHQGNLFAALKGVIDAGIPVPVNEACFPSQDRIRGSHIEAYTKSAKGSQFAATKNAASSIHSLFDQVKAAIAKNPAGKTPHSASAQSKK